MISSWVPGKTALEVCGNHRISGLDVCGLFHRSSRVVKTLPTDPILQTMPFPFHPCLEKTYILVLMQECPVSANDTPVAAAEGASGGSEGRASSLESPLELLQAMSEFTLICCTSDMLQAVRVHIGGEVRSKTKRALIAHTCTL